MKTLAAFLCIVPFAFIQAASEPVTAQQLQAPALEKCIKEKNSDGNKIKEIFKVVILPEDDPEFTDFFECYWKKTLVIQDDGTFNHVYIKATYPHLIREKFPSISEADAQKLADGAVEHCKEVPKGDSVGLRGIQYRNCMTAYVISKKYTT